MERQKSEVSKCGSSQDGPGLITEQHGCSCTSQGCETQLPPVEETVIQKLGHLEMCADEFPGSSATYRILEVTLYFPNNGVSEDGHFICKVRLERITQIVVFLLKQARFEPHVSLESSPCSFIYCFSFFFFKLGKCLGRSYKGSAQINSVYQLHWKLLLQLVLLGIKSNAMGHAGN